jgi:hypothetical protein
MTMTILGLLVMTSCPASEEQFAPVHGTVSYKGVALPAGTIVFTPDAARGGMGPTSRAEIKPDGSYVLKAGDQFGAVPGWHRVTIVAILPPGPPPPGQRFVHPQSLLPLKYRDPDLSGLHGEVKLGEDNTVNFHLD